MAAQAKQRKTHSWFTGFAPRNDPQIVVSVLIESAALAAPPPRRWPKNCSAFTRTNMLDRIHLREIDWVLIGLLLVNSAIGLVLIQGASYFLHGGFVVKQAVWILVSLLSCCCS